MAQAAQAQPVIDWAQIAEVRRLLRELAALGVKRHEYDLRSPYERRPLPPAR